MKIHNFLLTVVDTDSTAIVKQDMSSFSEQEQFALIEEINSYFPEKIKYAHDGYYDKCIVIRAKNYILYKEGKIKIRGSALKASTKCPALKEFIKEAINIMVYTDEIEQIKINLQELYTKYVKEIMNIQEIKRWAARKTLSSTMQESERTNETKIMEALADSSYVEGDRFYTFYKEDDSLCLVENFTGDYNRKRLLKNLFDTISIFDTILPIKELFINYSLKKNHLTLTNI